MIFDPLHSLALLEQKTNALDQAAPLVGWELPEEFSNLRRLLEARLSKRGKREYVQVLRLLETFSMAEVSKAIEDALLRRRKTLFYYAGPNTPPRGGFSKIPRTCRSSRGGRCSIRHSKRCLT